jgi:tetratricopeptide (TPR) repeat protein
MMMRSCAVPLDSKQAEGMWLGNLGNAYDSVGEHQRAIDCYEQALVIVRAPNNQLIEGVHLGNLGRAYMRLGELAKAEELLETSLRILEGLESPFAQIVSRKLEELRGQ